MFMIAMARKGRGPVLAARSLWDSRTPKATILRLFEVRKKLRLSRF